MATLAFDPASVNRTILQPIRPRAKRNLPGKPFNETLAISTTLTGNPAYSGNATLSVVSDPDGIITIPGLVQDGVPFDVVIDVRNLLRRPRTVTATVRASVATYTDQDMSIGIRLSPTGGPLG